MTQKLTNGLLALGLAVAVLLGLVAIGTRQAPATSSSQGEAPGTTSFGGGFLHTLPETFLQAIKLGDSNMNWTPTAQVGLGSDQVIVLANTSGKDIFVDYGEMQLAATPNGAAVASSTYNVRLIATSTATIPDSQDFTTIVGSSTTLVTGTWATSTVATTTNSVGSVPLGGQGAIILPSGFNLVAYINRAAACQNGSCETATSSNRGFIAKIRARYHFDD